MDRRYMFKATGPLGKSTAEATRAKTTQQRATQRNNLHAAQRNISPLDEPIIDVPVVERMHRVDKLKQWRIEREIKKQQDAATKKKPFLTVVKKGVFLDTTNYIDFNKKYRQKSSTKKKNVKKTTTNATSSQKQSLASESNVFPHITGEDCLPVPNHPKSENTNDVDMSTDGSAENIESELNSTFEVLTLTGNKQDKSDSVKSGGVSNNNDEASSSNGINLSRKNRIKTSTKTSLNFVNPELSTTSRIKQEKIEAVSGDEVPNNNDEASSLNDINRLRKTPVRTSLRIKQDKIEAVSGDEVPNNNDEASSSNDINRETPTRISLRTSLNNSLNYVSPFVTVSRGKRSAQKEKNVRESLYKLETSQPGYLSPTTRRNREAGAYFRNQVNSETERLLQTTNIWAEYKVTNSHIDSVYIDQIDVAIGQTKLLISKKFNQFLNLIDQCENETGEQSVLPKDLEGFWSMVYMQVDNCNDRFENLEKLKSNNWIEVGLTPVKVVKQKKPKISKKGQGVSASSGIKKMVEAAREKLQESKRATAVAALSNSKDFIHPKSLRQTPVRRSSVAATVIAKTPKSIIKTPGVKRNAKNVVFAALESASNAPSPNLLAVPTPKASLRSRRASTSGIPTQSKHHMTQGNITFSTPQSTRNNQQTSSIRRSRRILLFSTTSDK